MASLFKSSTTHDPIKRLLNAESMDERDRLTEEWRDRKLQELNFIGVVVSLSAAAFLGLHDTYYTNRALFSLACFLEPVHGRAF